MLTIDYLHCLSCAGCIGLCPEMALFLDREGLKVKPENCTLCLICIDFCPVLALSMNGNKADIRGANH